MIELVIGTIAPNDSIETLRQSVDFLQEGTPVRVTLAESPGDLFGYVSGVRLDTGRRGSVRERTYRPDRYVRDIPPNVVCYLVRDEITGGEFECAPSKVLPYVRTHGNCLNPEECAVLPVEAEAALTKAARVIGPGAARVLRGLSQSRHESR